VSAADQYRKKAAMMAAMAKRAESAKRRAVFAGLELSYQRLAQLAEKNAKTDIVYQTPPRPEQRVAQQQQQRQPKKKKRES
jgi:hypothetical protein